MIHAVRELQRKKNRTENGLFLLEGPKLLKEAMKSGIQIKQIFAKESWFANTIDKIPENVMCASTNNEELERISQLSTPNEVVAIALIPERSHVDLPENNELVIYLDNINDPGNLGTIIRLADWFGLKGIVISSGSVDPYNPKVVQSSMGSLFRVKVEISDPENYLHKAKQASIKIMGADMDGKDIYSTDISGGGIVVMGSESHGISEQAKSFLTDTISIPNFSANEEVESLNVSMASAIIISEYKASQQRTN